MRIIAAIGVAALSLALCVPAQAAQRSRCGPGLEARVSCLEQTVAALQSQIKSDLVTKVELAAALKDKVSIKDLNDAVEKAKKEAVAQIPNLNKVKIIWKPYWMTNRDQCLFFVNENEAIKAETCDHDREEFVEIRPQ